MLVIARPHRHAKRLTPAPLAYNPHNRHQLGGSVQRGLSAAIAPAAGFGVRGATDRRCSLGRPFLIEPINWRIRPCDSYLPSRCCSAQYHRSHLLIAIQSTRLKVNLFIGQLLSRLIFLCRSQRGSRFAFRIINLFSSRTNWSAPALALLQMQETQTDVEHWVQPISAASMTLIPTARGAASPELQALTFLSRAINALPPSGVNETTACRCT